MYVKNIDFYTYLLCAIINVCNMKTSVKTEMCLIESNYKRLYKTIFKKQIIFKGD